MDNKNGYLRIAQRSGVICVLGRLLFPLTGEVCPKAVSYFVCSFAAWNFGVTLQRLGLLISCRLRRAFGQNLDVAYKRFLFYEQKVVSDIITTVKTSGYYESTYTNDSVLSAYTHCRVHRQKSELEIVSLFATKDYSYMSFEDMLLEEVITYARVQGLDTIYFILGPEPMNPKPYLTVEEVKHWYLSNGFVLQDGVLSQKVVYKIPPI